MIVKLLIGTGNYDNTYFWILTIFSAFNGFLWISYILVLSLLRVCSDRIYLNILSQSGKKSPAYVVFEDVL